MSLFGELKRRNVLRVAAAYIVFAWLVIQVVETILPAFGFGDAAVRNVTIAFAIGLVPTLVAAWVFELTPQGLKRDEDVRPVPSIALHNARRLDRIILLVLAAALGYFAFDKFVLDPARDASRIENARREGASEAAEATDNSVAVLPFVNMSSDPEQEYFADGLTEELLNLLARVPELRVTARTSSFFFKGRDLPVPEIAAALGVSYVLEGSVRRSAGRVRITAQLIEARSDRHLWSETFDRELRDLFAVQDEVAGAITSAMVGSFDQSELKPVSRAQSLAAQEAYRTGRLLWWRRTPEDLQRAIDLFERAVESDPGFAPAYAAVADASLLQHIYGEVQILDAVNRGREMAERALELDPDCAEAHAALGLAGLIVGEKGVAEADLRRAIELDPDYIPAYLWLANLFGDQGRAPEQGAVLQQALERDPLNEMLATEYAENLALRGDYPGARELLDGLLRLRPDFPVLLSVLSDLALGSGELAAALDYAEQAGALDPENTQVVLARARALAALGSVDEAEELLQEAQRHSPRNVDIKRALVDLYIVQVRLEDAEAMMARLFPADVSWLPEGIQRTYHFYRGLLAGEAGDPVAARDHFERSLNPDQTQLYEDEQFLSLTLAALLNRALGAPQRAEEQLQTAERVIGYARLNGIDNAALYYSAACLFALRGETERSLQSLQQAVDRGERRLWLFERDPRLEPLHGRAAFEEIRESIRKSIDQARQEGIRSV